MSEAGVRDTSHMEREFPGWFEGIKHNHYADYGWPPQLDFGLLYSMYHRNAVARAAVVKTAERCWLTNPNLRQKKEEVGSNREMELIEEQFHDHLTKILFWQKIVDADRKSMVGKYSALIFRLADGKDFDQPVGNLRGIEGLVEVIPVWEDQIMVSEYDSDPESETYGKPKQYSFTGTPMNPDDSGTGGFEIHPDRILIWSDTGNMNDDSLLGPGYNEILNIEKITGAGGEGFWKNAKGGLMLSVDKETDIGKWARDMGIPENEVADQVEKNIKEFNKGMDVSFMMQGAKLEPIHLTLPEVNGFFWASLNAFASSIQMPVKILVGMQTGERASKEDNKEWNQTCMARRNNILVPNLITILERFKEWGVLPGERWHIDWDPLSEASINDKREWSKAMATMNKEVGETGEMIWTIDEIRDAAGYPPLDPSEYQKETFDEGPEDSDTDESDPGESRSDPP